MLLVPMAITGVVIGLLSTGLPFSFTALLGLLSLSGMLIKNGTATTIPGMIPLLADAFFVSMAVTIMAGLAFGSVLTLIAAPVLYYVFFRQDKKSAPLQPISFAGVACLLHAAVSMMEAGILSPSSKQTPYSEWRQATQQGYLEIVKTFRTPR